MVLKPKHFSLLALTVWLTGCTSVITNLTPQKYTRKGDDLYHVEFQWDSRQQSIVPGSLKPQVLIGTEFFPMEPVSIVTNRWETLIPVPADQKLIHYQFKVDYQYYGMPSRGSSSRLSPPYRLEIIDK
jgi:hypothetical protein